MTDIDEFWSKLINQTSFQNLTIQFPGFSEKEIDRAVRRTLSLKAMQGATVRPQAEGPNTLYLLSIKGFGDMGHIRLSAICDDVPTLDVSKYEAIKHQDILHRSFMFYLRRFFMFLKMDTLWQQKSTTLEINEHNTPTAPASNGGDFFMGRELSFPGWDIAYVKNRLKEAPSYLKKGGYIIFDEGDSWLINNEYHLFLELHAAYRGCVLRIFSEIERIYANSPNPWPPRWEGTKKLYQDYDRSRHDLPMLSLGIVEMFYPRLAGISLDSIVMEQALINLRDFGEWVAPDGASWRFMYDNHIGEENCMIFGDSGDERIIIHAHRRPYGTELSLNGNATIEIFDAFCQELETHFNGQGMVRGETLSLLERGIIQAYKELKNKPDRVTDEMISTWLAIKGITNKKGEPYTREYVNKVRNKLIDKGKLTM